MQVHQRKDTANSIYCHMIGTTTHTNRTRQCTTKGTVNRRLQKKRFAPNLFSALLLLSWCPYRCGFAKVERRLLYRMFGKKWGASQWEHGPLKKENTCCRISIGCAKMRFEGTRANLMRFAKRRYILLWPIETYCVINFEIAMLYVAYEIRYLWCH